MYQDRYKKGGKKSFSVVVSRNLKQLEDLRLIKQEGDYWGTKESSPPGTERESEITDKDTIELLKTAADLAAKAPPVISRDVYIQKGKYRVKVEHE